MSTVFKMPPATPTAPGPDETFVAQVRDRLAVRCPSWDRRYPRVLDLEAQILADMHEETSGHSSALSGEQSPRHFRDAFIGDRELSLRTVCHLVQSLNPAGPAAVRRLQRRLESAMGLRVGVSLAEAAARLASEAGDVSSATLRALEDGHAGPDDVETLDRELAQAEAACSTMRQVLARLKAQVVAVGAAR